MPYPAFHEYRHQAVKDVDYETRTRFSFKTPLDFPASTGVDIVNSGADGANPCQSIQSFFQNQLLLNNSSVSCMPFHVLYPRP